MALTHLSTIFCDYLIRHDNGQFTYAGVFRNIVSPVTPIVRSPLCVSIEFTGTAHEPFKITLEGIGMNLTLAEGVTEELPNEMPEFQMPSMVVAGNINLNVPEPGTLYVVLRNGDTEVHRTPLGIVVKE